MIVCVLCGGIGSRLEDYSFPKPLNMIYGKPSISLCLKNLPESIQTIHFIVAPHLVKYNFAEIVTNEFKSRTCVFHYLPYFTRGPIESAYVGLQDMTDTGDENIVFLDNDVMYNFPDTLFETKTHPFLGYSIDKTNNEKFSYLLLNDEMNVIDFKEKKRISNLFCCGVYGFQTIAQFRFYALKNIVTNTSSELYMSMLFHDMLCDTITIKGIFMSEDIHHIGSLKELRESLVHIPKRIMRVCFDLDNTLVTYPTVPNDYTTVKPIETMISLAQKLHAEGHTIIIHTARRMLTHKHNIGAAIKDIGMITFQTLSDFKIPYDEIIFGKPIADMYIDDRAMNPYRNDLYSMGYINNSELHLPLNSLKPNKNNTLQVIDDIVVKKGPLRYIDGEIFFYKHIPKDSDIVHYFPKYIASSEDILTGTLQLEHIRGIPVFTLYKTGILTEDTLRSFLEFLSILHSNSTTPIVISRDKVIANYTEKLRQRFLNQTDFPFEDAEAVQAECLSRLQIYIAKDTMKIVPYIHGDFWFSNIILDFKGQLKTLDMKGKVFDTLTTNGDRMYDYGKIYQSLLGYDCILNDVPLPKNHKILRTFFEHEIATQSISLEDLQTITFSLIIGTLTFIESVDTKHRVWNWMKTTFLKITEI